MTRMENPGSLGRLAGKGRSTVTARRLSPIYPFVAPRSIANEPGLNRPLGRVSPATSLQLHAALSASTSECHRAPLQVS